MFWVPRTRFSKLSIVMKINIECGLLSALTAVQSHTYKILFLRSLMDLKLRSELLYLNDDQELHSISTCLTAHINGRLTESLSIFIMSSWSGVPQICSILFK